MEYYTDKQRKLIFSLIQDFSMSYFEKKDSYHITKSEQILKKAFMEDTGFLIAKKKPFKDLRVNIKACIEKALKNGARSSEDILDNIEEYVISEVQRLITIVRGTFSLRADIFLKDDATKFINFLINYFFDNGIEIKKEIIDMIKEDEEIQLMYVLLKYKKCAICGRYADLHHFDSVASIGGYEFDDGLKTRFMPLCREHHTEFHAIGVQEFVKKYKIKGIYLNSNQIKVLKSVYKNHFKAFKGENSPTD